MVSLGKQIEVLGTQISIVLLELQNFVEGKRDAEWVLVQFNWLVEEVETLLGFGLTGRHRPLVEAFLVRVKEIRDVFETDEDALAARQALQEARWH